MSQIVPNIPVTGVISGKTIAEKIGAGRTALKIADEFAADNPHFVPTARGALMLASDLLDAKPAPQAGDDGSPAMLPQRAPAPAGALLPGVKPARCDGKVLHDRVQPERDATIDMLSEPERWAHDELNRRLFPGSGALAVSLSRTSRAVSGRFDDVYWHLRVSELDTPGASVSVEGVRLDQVVSEVICRFVLQQFDAIDEDGFDIPGLNDE